MPHGSDDIGDQLPMLLDSWFVMKLLGRLVIGQKTRLRYPIGYYVGLHR